MSTPHPILVFVIYFLAFFIPGALLQVLMTKEWRRRHLPILIGLSLLGAVLVFVWDFVVKPALLR